MTTHVHQQLLTQTVQSLFPNHHIKTNVQRASGIQSPSGGYLELDVWIPGLNIAFEFQDPHHYVTAWYSEASLDNVKRRDKMKKEWIEERGQVLFEIPCWWDGSHESIVATIRERRPDLLSHLSHLQSSPIPSEPPNGFFPGPQIPLVGELMLASFAMGERDLNMNSWYLSEKYDGVRAFALEHKFYSRRGRELTLPPEILSHVYNSFDGEIWFGRDSFQQTQQILFSKPIDSTLPLLHSTNWTFFRYVVFDRFDPTELFEGRYTSLLSFISTDAPFIIVTSQVLCRDSSFVNYFKKEVFLENNRNEVEGETQDVIKGEGIILRQPQSAYTSGRSEKLLKIKEIRDEEGLIVWESENVYKLQIIGIKPLIQAHLSPNFVSPMPKIGDIVSFSFNNYSSLGSPTHAQIIRVRNDMQSEIHNSGTPPPKPFGYWTKEGNANIKKFFDDFARSRDLDPLVPDSWYSFTNKHIRCVQGGGSILRHYNSCLSRALIDIYPDIGLQESKFDLKRKKYWKASDNKRQFLEELAKDFNFDPLVAQNWRKIDTYTVYHNGGGTLLNAYNGSLSKALVDCFPEVSFK